MLKAWKLGVALTVGYASLLTVGSYRAPVMAQAQTEAQWLTDYDAARTLAQKERKPLFVVFR